MARKAIVGFLVIFALCGGLYAQDDRDFSWVYEEGARLRNYRQQEERQQHEWRYNVPRLFIGAGPTVNILKIKAGAARDTEYNFKYFDEGSQTKTKVGIEATIGADLRDMKIPFIVGFSYQNFGKITFDDHQVVDTGIGLFNPGRVWRQAKVNLHNFSFLAKWAVPYKSERFQPFVTGRIGAALIDADMKGYMTYGDPVHTMVTPDPVSRSKWAMSYGIGAGVDYKVNRCLSVNAGYEYFGTKKVELTELSGKVSVTGHSFKVMLGLSF